MGRHSADSGNAALCPGNLERTLGEVMSDLGRQSCQMPLSLRASLQLIDSARRSLVARSPICGARSPADPIWRCIRKGPAAESIYAVKHKCLKMFQLARGYASLVAFGALVDEIGRAHV